jgi:hypothetical protein
MVEVQAIETSRVARRWTARPRTLGPRRLAEAGHRATPALGPASRFGRNLAVAIGIDMYGEGIAPLRSAVADADAIAELLERDHGFEVWRLLDDSARLSHLLALLTEDLPAALGPDDRLLFYFAGHCVSLDGDAGPEAYLVPAGARRGDRRGFLPMQRLHDALQELPVRHALIVLDCCFAGAFQWPSMRDVEPVAPLYRERYDHYLERPAWQVLTSTRSDELALDTIARDVAACGSADEHSPFALALLEGLSSGADYTHDNLITADELVIYVRERICPPGSDLWPRQVPQLFPLKKHGGGQFLFQVPNRPPLLPPAPPLHEDANPYRGLLSYGEHNAALFFGRADATRQLVEAVRARRLTAVVGPSGSGKSSLVHAGLIPALRALGWQILSTQQPGPRPRHALAALARELGAEPAALDPVAWVSAIVRRVGSAPWLVVIDQLEELLADPLTDADRAAFLEALALALEACPSLHLVVVARSDAEPRLRDSALEEAWQAGRFEVPPMTRDELRQVIELPAAAAVVYFEPAWLVDRVLEDVALLPAPLPLLSFALSELYRRCWQRWQAGDAARTLEEADYDAMGGVAAALTRRATAVYDELVTLDPAYARTIRNVFLRMVAHVSGKLTRRRVPSYELVFAAAAENRRVAKVLQRFERARLISRGLQHVEHGRMDAMSSYVEPVHDELVLRWALLARWLAELDAAPGRQALLGALACAVAVWRAHKLHDDYLWKGLGSELVLRLGRHRSYAFNVYEALFLRRGACRWRRSAARLVAALVAAICVLAAIAGLALWQWSAALDATPDAARVRPAAPATAPACTRARTP